MDTALRKIESDVRGKIDPESVLSLFSAMGDVYLFMKDREGRFIGANQLQLEKLGLETEADLVGKTDYDFFPSYMIAGYAKDDMRVMETGEPVLRRVELVANPDGTVSWQVTTKYPLYDRDGKCTGIIGFMRDFERTNNALQSYRRMNAALDFISENYANPITVADLARVAGLSVSQFERRFRAVFDQTPARFLIQYRLTRASQILAHSDATISRIAHEVGFYDHSHFSREFQKLFNMPPGQYRKRHSES